MLPYALLITREKELNEDEKSFRNHGILARMV